MWYDHPNGILSVRNPASVSGENPDGDKERLPSTGVIPFVQDGNWAFSL
ncbi:hypothetical protein KAX17_12630 [Candidatus Bipolaricaulota bacterium]|nr:hypothetical protein [Candidatus Bipolaricaulota bacterium]